MSLKVRCAPVSVVPLLGQVRAAAGGKPDYEASGPTPEPVRIWGWEVNANRPPFGRTMELTLTSAGYDPEEDGKVLGFLAHAMSNPGGAYPRVIELRIVEDEEAALTVDQREERRKTKEALDG